jgi:hypothetical protein
MVGTDSEGGERRVKTALLAVLFSIVAVGAQAGNLDALKSTARSYVMAMEAALALSGTSSCTEIITAANEYAKAKIAYYDAARAAMPTLLQSARGESSGTADEKELTEIFRGFGEDQDEEASEVLEGKLGKCPTSDERERKHCLQSRVPDRLLKNLLRILGRWKEYRGDDFLRVKRDKNSDDTKLASPGRDWVSRMDWSALAIPAIVDLAPLLFAFLSSSPRTSFRHNSPGNAET